VRSEEVSLLLLFRAVLILLAAYARARISAAGERPPELFRKTS
jgi:hypothetical protein